MRWSRPSEPVRIIYLINTAVHHGPGLRDLQLSFHSVLLPWSSDACVGTPGHGWRQATLKEPDGMSGGALICFLPQLEQADIDLPQIVP